MTAEQVGSTVGTGIETWAAKGVFPTKGLLSIDDSVVAATTGVVSIWGFVVFNSTSSLFTSLSSFAVR
jgi:hypothetical protein